MNDKLRVSLPDLLERWTFEQVVDAHIVLDYLQEVEDAYEAKAKADAEAARRTR